MITFHICRGNCGKQKCAIISRHIYFRCFDEYSRFYSLIHEPFGISPYYAKWTRMDLCSPRWKYVIYITAFLFIFTLYLFEFQKRKEPQVINENKNGRNLQQFPPEIRSVWREVILKSESGKPGAWFALDFWMELFKNRIIFIIPEKWMDS